MLIHESDYGLANYHVTRNGDELNVTLTYPPASRGHAPNRDSAVTYVSIDQESVRASGGIRVHFDYARDGFVIEQPTVFEWDVNDEICDSGYQETAFVRAYHPSAQL